MPMGNGRLKYLSELKNNLRAQDKNWNAQVLFLFCLHDKEKYSFYQI